MKTVIIYASVHHNNTKELVCAIAAENDIDVVDATKINEKDLSGYDLIGFASGIYFGKMHQSVINFAEVNLPENKDVFHMFPFFSPEYICCSFFCNLCYFRNLLK